MSDIFRRKQPGEAWETAVVSSGGGGSPGGVSGDVQYNNAGSFGGIQQSLFDVDPTTGAVTISPSDDAVDLSLNPAGVASADWDFRIGNQSTPGAFLGAGIFDDSGTPRISLQMGDLYYDDSFGLVVGEHRLRVGQLGFFGATPAAKPTGVPVTAAGVHAALVTLGLISA